jgi:hypothetical protein
MNKNDDSIVVYWGTPNFQPKVESWSMLYSTPRSLSSLLRENKSANSPMFICPATKDVFKNVFVFKSTFYDKHILPIDYLKETQSLVPKFEREVIPTDGTIQMVRVRPSSLLNHSNIVYNMAWLLFSEESLLAKFTAPYCPPTSPALGAILSPGQFDIGQWYRPFNLDYHIPTDTKTFEIKENDDLFYIQFYTDKKIIFKQYVVSDKLLALLRESTEAPKRYGPFKSLQERYFMASKTNYSKLVLSEIKNNLIE